MSPELNSSFSVPSMASVITFCSVLYMASVIHATITIDRVEMCDSAIDYPIKWMMKVKNENKGQTIEEGSLSSRVDLNNDVLETIKIYSLEEKEWMFVFGKEGGFCEIKDLFFGELATVLEKAAGIQKTCPYPKGTYKITDIPIDWSKMKFQDFPAGVVKLRLEFNNTKTEAYLGCLEAEMTIKK